MKYLSREISGLMCVDLQFDLPSVRYCIEFQSDQIILYTHHTEWGRCEISRQHIISGIEWECLLFVVAEVCSITSPNCRDQSSFDMPIIIMPHWVVRPEFYFYFTHIPAIGWVDMTCTVVKIVLLRILHLNVLNVISPEGSCIIHYISTNLPVSQG